MLPIPRHLETILKPIGNDNTEFEVVGQMVCNCGSDKFKIEIVGDDSEYESDCVIKVQEIADNYFLIVKLHCNDCDKEHLVFDNDYHGWNGFICGGDSKELPRPKTKVWNCNKCQTANHSITLTIQSQGQEDFVEEAGDEFESKDWTEAFSWITMKTECKNCGVTNDEWISYETM